MTDVRVAAAQVEALVSVAAEARLAGTTVEVLIGSKPVRSCWGVPTS